MTSKFGYLGKNGYVENTFPAVLTNNLVATYSCTSLSSYLLLLVVEWHTEFKRKKRHGVFDCSPGRCELSLGLPLLISS